MIAFDIKTTAQFVENISDQLALLGAHALTLLDAGDEAIYEPKPKEIILWDQVQITAYFADEMEEEIIAWLSELKAQTMLSDFSYQAVVEKNWVRASLDQFKPLCFGKRICICPSWELPPAKEGLTTVFIDPGLAFGTGTHPTTALCLTWLSDHLKGGERIIDYGAGSGLLGIAAKKLGALKVYAIDYDEQAIEATQLNAMLNKLDEDHISIALKAPTDIEPVDIIIANILAKTIIELADDFARLLKAQGQLVVSGILKEQCAEVIAALKNQFSFIEDTKEAEWVCLHLQKLN